MQDALRPALDDFDAALKLNPNDADALAGRGTALMMRGRAADVAEATAAAEKSLRPRPWTVPRLMACAGIYARAAGVLEAANDPEAGRCLRRALGLLREAMALVPAKERPTFWRDGVLTDPALLPLQRTTGMVGLGADLRAVAKRGNSFHAANQIAAAPVRRAAAAGAPGRPHAAVQLHGGHGGGPARRRSAPATRPAEPTPSR